MSDHSEYSSSGQHGRHSANRQTPQNQQSESQSSQESNLTPQQIQANKLYEQRQAAARSQQAQPAQQPSQANRNSAQNAQQSRGAQQPGASQTARQNTQQYASQGRGAGQARQGQGSASRPSVQTQQRQFSMPENGRQPAYAAGGRQSGTQAAGPATFGDINKQGKGKKKGGVWRVVFWLALVVFLASLAALGVIAYNYWQEQNMYSEIASEAFEPPADISGTSLADMTVDWDALLAKNPDTVGWVYVPGTEINYPIVQTTDNVKYLKTNFYGETNWVVSPGTIFLAAENAADFSDANNLVYGHHMNDGSMFAAIDTFTDPAEFNGHRTIYILTPQGNYRLETFSLVICSGDDPLAQTSFASAEEMQSYIQDKMNRSVVTPDPNDVTPESITKLFSFVTCDYSINDGRAVLFASVVESTVAGASAQDPAAETGEEAADPSLVNPEDAANVGEAAEEYV